MVLCGKSYKGFEQMYLAGKKYQKDAAGPDCNMPRIGPTMVATSASDDGNPETLLMSIHFGGLNFGYARTSLHRTGREAMENVADGVAMLRLAYCRVVIPTPDT